MESDELGNDLVRIEEGFLVDEEAYVVNSDDVLGKLPTYRLSVRLFQKARNKIRRVITNSKR